ncbi:YceI family protein [Paenibacillus sp. LHD-117]|uniref:YceI family protein n=1 Tax=Paenibacillus sp. LHD-117 TaxID=3071412 RepID=UPI0027E08C1F|nr:YceI family protein [Paenibacillus sp. LHD-117]MDQ6420144.1 YceI family protein [Paenibacillus sp. LHD-117]
MKKKHIVFLAVSAAVVLGAGAYAAMDRYLGNNVEVESVMGSQEAPAPSNGTESVAGAGNGTANASVPADELNGMWAIASGSKVYWSVTTSKETVNFVNEAVTGSWSVDLSDPAVMTGEGTLDMNALDSGNGQRDGHMKERADLLQVSEFPQATFRTKSFSEMPAEWTEGTAVPLTIEGTLTVKGVEKDVAFDSTAMFRDGQLLLSGTSKVKFSDFGMTSPHTIVLEAENDLSVQLELVLQKA